MAKQLLVALVLVVGLFQGKFLFENFLIGSQMARLILAVSRI
jgi:hypothetical protein